jgi:hypothetical protein
MQHSIYVIVECSAATAATTVCQRLAGTLTRGAAHRLLPIRTVAVCGGEIQIEVLGDYLALAGVETIDPDEKILSSS